MTARPRTSIGSLALMAALAATLVFVPQASAKLWFDDLGGERLRWDERVTTAIAGCAGSEDCRAYVSGTEVFLRSVASRPSEVGRPRHTLGHIDRNGRLTFRTPKIHAGRFQLAARIRLGRERRWDRISGTFRVLAAPVPEPSEVSCSGRSSAAFPEAFTSPRNVVEGPVVLVGAASRYSTDDVRELGGDKLAVLVAPGHRVTIEVGRPARSEASLFFEPRGGILSELNAYDGQAAVTFAACSHRRSDSRAGSRRVTFWMGFLLVDKPVCLPLRIWIDGAAWPRTRMLRIGVDHCD